MYDLDNEPKLNPEGRKDGMTERGNTICPSHFMAGGIKIYNLKQRQSTTASYVYHPQCIYAGLNDSNMYMYINSFKLR